MIKVLLPADDRQSAWKLTAVTWAVDNGNLSIFDAESNLVAEFAAGCWIGVLKTEAVA